MSPNLFTQHRRRADAAGEDAPPRQRRDPIPWHSPRLKHDPFPWRSGSRRSARQGDPFSFRTGSADITRFIGSRRSRRYLAKEQVEDAPYDEPYAAPEGYAEEPYAAPDAGEPYAAPPLPREKRDPYTMGRMNSDISRFIAGNAHMNRFAGGRERRDDEPPTRPRGSDARARFVENDGSWSPGENAARAARTLLGF